MALGGGFRAASRACDPFVVQSVGLTLIRVTAIDWRRSRAQPAIDRGRSGKATAGFHFGTARSHFGWRIRNCPNSFWREELSEVILARPGATTKGHFGYGFRPRKVERTDLQGKRGVNHSIGMVNVALTISGEVSLRLTGLLRLTPRPAFVNPNGYG